MRLVFFGTPAFAVPSLQALLDSPDEVAGVVTQPDRPRGRGHHVADTPVKALARAQGLPVLQPERMRDPAFVETIAGLSPDLGVVAAYGRILPEALIAVPRLGLINVHASLLPAWRGASPVHRAVMAGDRETGVTIMRVVAELDAGPMLARAARSIGDDETSVDVERDLAQLGASLLGPVIRALATGTAVEEPQDHAHATFAPRLKKEDGVIDWSWPARRVHDQVRGLHPWPLAYSWLDGHRVLVLDTRPVTTPSLAAGGEPGAIVESRSRLVVACGHATAIELRQVQPEGRRAMSARDFLAGHRISPATRFSSRPPA